MMGILQNLPALWNKSHTEGTTTGSYYGGRTYVCAGCKKEVPWENGAADDMPNHCDDCWAEAHKEEFMKKIVLFDDDETWSMASTTRVVEVTDELFAKLEAGENPKHLNLPKGDLIGQGEEKLRAALTQLLEAGHEAAYDLRNDVKSLLTGEVTLVVFAVLYSHRHGNDVWVKHTHAQALASVRDTMLEWVAEEFEGRENLEADIRRALDEDDVAVAMHIWEASTDEYFEITECTL